MLRRDLVLAGATGMAPRNACKPSAAAGETVAMSRAVPAVPTDHHLPMPPANPRVRREGAGYSVSRA